jgi:diphthamide biosynthesis protein 2
MLLRQKRKKSYTISVGRLNPAKLANFAEVECFVLVACPENSLIDSKVIFLPRVRSSLTADGEQEFFKPIVTPYELEIALGIDGTTWGRRYVLDFDELLAKERKEQNECQFFYIPWRPLLELREIVANGEDKDDDRPAFSLVTGKYRQARRFGGEHDHLLLHP